MSKFAFKPALSLKGRKFFGFRGWAGKPLHPPLTDIPIGAYSIAAALDVASYFWPSYSWAATLRLSAGFVYLGGAVVSVATALTGLFDWFTTEKGTHVRKEANAHAWLMVLMTVLVGANLVFRYLYDDSPTSGLLLVVLGLAIAALAVVGGTIGGSLVFDYGFNVLNSKDHPAYHEDSPEMSSPRYRPPKADKTKESGE